MVLYNSLNDSSYYLETPTGKFFMIIPRITLPSEQSIINYESATGDGGITINNGRICEEISMEGVILGNSESNLLDRCSYLTYLKENGTVIDFIHPFIRLRRDKGNKYYIKKIEFNLEKANRTAVPFTMTLVEYREANVKTTSVNLVNYQTADFMKQYYFNLVGNL